MIRYTATLARLAWEGYRRGPLALDAADERTFVAAARYCDQNLHLNNAHYLTFMDYGRIGWLARNGLMKQVVAARIPLLLGGVTIAYRREIPLGATFTLRTESAGYDTEWLYCAQTFLLEDGRPAARGLVRAAVRFRGERKPPSDLLERLGPLGPPPPLSEEIQRWNAATAPLLDAMKQVGS
jgi:acyl-CoA thioesterase FadM